MHLKMMEEATILVVTKKLLVAIVNHKYYQK